VIEDRRCDLWLELVEEGRALIVVVENKVDAVEHDEQLSSYEQAVWKWARDHRRNSFEQRLVFLTPGGRAPDGLFDHEAWLTVSYKHSRRIGASRARRA
jgi:PD-(D/E)XK nuclease superfamily